MMEIVSSFLAGIGIVLLLRYSFGKQINNNLLGLVFLLLFASLTLLNYFAEPFTIPFQVGISVIFIVLSILLIVKMPPQEIDLEKRDDPVKTTEADHKDMTRAGWVFLVLMLLSGIFYFVMA